MSSDPTTTGPIPPDLAPNCACKHRLPPLGTADTCPYTPGITCGGWTHCPICRANNPKTEEVALEPDSIVGWVAGPNGTVYYGPGGFGEIKTSSGNAIPREATPMRRPIERALYAVAQTLADALQAKDWRHAEAALEEWRMFRADLERHVDGDERDRRELVAWIAEMSKQEPRIEFEAEFSARMVDVIDRLVIYGMAEKDGLDLWAMKSPAEKSDWVRKLADKCARAARVTGWREREQS